MTETLCNCPATSRLHVYNREMCSYDERKNRRQDAAK